MDRIPVINKHTINSFKDKFIPNNVSNQKLIWGHSSGTSGTPISLPFSQKCLQIDYAYRTLSYVWANLNNDRKEKIGFCAGHPVAQVERDIPPFWTYDFFSNVMYMSSYHMSKKNLVHYISELEKFKPKILSGYPSSIYLLAKANRTNGTGKLSNIVIFTSSETLLEFQRQEIEESFQSKVYNFYGNAERCGKILECNKGELHFMPTHSFVEILDNFNKPAEPGQVGRIVATNFNNPCFPLIRYDVGDTVLIAKNQKPACGSNGVLIDKVYGRIEDYIHTPKGRMVGRLDHIFKDASFVRNAQLEQNSTDELIIRIVPEDGYSEKIENTILNETVQRLGREITIKFDYVKNIPKDRNGKYQFVRSNL
jgi:phenylacetate-CoA ligase